MTDTSPQMKQTAINLLKERRDAWLLASRYPTCRYDVETKVLDPSSLGRAVAGLRVTVFNKETGMLVDSRAFELRFDIAEASLLPALAA